ncbi:unnamed protein product, partial [Amoebophrya sp. A120]
ISYDSGADESGQDQDGGSYASSCNSGLVAISTSNSSASAMSSSSAGGSSSSSSFSGPGSKKQHPWEQMVEHLVEISWQNFQSGPMINAASLASTSATSGGADDHAGKITTPASITAGANYKSPFKISAPGAAAAAAPAAVTDITSVGAAAVGAPQHHHEPDFNVKVSRVTKVHTNDHLLFGGSTSNNAAGGSSSSTSMVPAAAASNLLHAGASTIPNGSFDARPMTS